MTTEIKILVTGADKELNDAIINILSSKLLGLNMVVESTKTDSTLHMSSVHIRNKQALNQIKVSIKQDD